MASQKPITCFKKKSCNNPQYTICSVPISSQTQVNAEQKAKELAIFFRKCKVEKRE